MSLTSNSRHGSGFCLFEPNVLKSPGSSDVRHTWNSIVFGLEITTDCMPVSTRRIFLKASSCEQSAKVSASVKPASAISRRMRSVRRERGCCEPTHWTGATSRGILLNEYATATSSITSHACITSGRVIGTPTRTLSPLASSSASSCTRAEPGAMRKGG